MFYRQPIILFCLVLPLLVAAILFGACAVGMSNVKDSLSVKKKTFEDNETSLRTVAKIEKEVKQERPHMERWNASLSVETASSVAMTLRQIMENLPSREIQQTAFERPSTVGGFGSVSPQKSSMLRISFRGTFRTLQRAILELETRMPQLQLQDMKLDPVSGQSNLVNMQVTYTAWEN